MWKILRHYGIPEKIVNAMQCLYETSTSSVQLNGQLSEPLNVNSGVLQGDTLAQFLFIVVLDFILHNRLQICNLLPSARSPQTRKTHVSKIHHQYHQSPRHCSVERHCTRQTALEGSRGRLQCSRLVWVKCSNYENCKLT